MSNEIVRIKQILRELSGIHKYTRKTIYEEHNYVNVWSSLSEIQRTKPAKMLFMEAILSKRTSTPSEEEIDISGSPEISPSPFDCMKNKVLANDLERSLNFYLKDDCHGSELKNFPSQNYCPSKQRMYREVMEVVNDNTLARVAYSGQPHEFIKRKLIAERCGRRLRFIFANSLYDSQENMLWIHKVILDNGDVVTIASYLGVLQALRLMSPAIVDLILKSYNDRLKYDYVSQIVKKQWDPSTTVLNQYKPKKIPGTPLLIMCHIGFRYLSQIDPSARFDRWMNNLSAMCKTMLLPMTCDDGENLDKAVNDFKMLVIDKVMESKNHFPKRPVILAGWSVAALIASYAALEVAVDAVICFGFPLIGVNGSCVDSDDILLENKAPVLFIVGQNSNRCSTDDIEDLRSNMNTVTGLVIVGGADDLLLVSPNKMILEGISQEIVDRCILDEISEFLENILRFSPAKNVMLSNPAIEISDEAVTKKKSKTSRKRTKDSTLKPKSTSKRAKVATSKASSLSTKCRSSPSNPQSSNSGSGGKKRVRFKLDETSVKRRIGKPPSKNIKKKCCIKLSSRVPNQKVSRIIKSPSPTFVISSTPESSFLTPSVLDTSNQKVSKVHHKSPEHPSFSPKSCIDLSSKHEVSSKVFTSVSNKSPMVSVSSPGSSSLRKIALVLPPKPFPLAIKVMPLCKDNLFLHKSSSPVDGEDAVSADETKSIIKPRAISLPKPGTSKLASISSTNLIPQIVKKVEKQTPPFFKQSSTALLSSKATLGTVIKPVSKSSSVFHKGSPVYLTPSTYKLVSPTERLKSGSGLIRFRNESRVNLSHVDPIHPKFSSIVPLKSNKVMVPNRMLETSPKKVIRTLPKNIIPLKTGDEFSDVTRSKNDDPSSSNQAANFSSFANMKDPNQPSKSCSKLNIVLPSATFLKIKTPSDVQNIKRMEALKVPSTGPKIGTHKETVEKQLAVKVLPTREILKTTTSVPTKIPGSIFYKNSGGSVMSETFPPTTSATKLSQPILPFTHIKNVQSDMPTKPQ